MIEADWVLAPIIENASSEELSGSSLSSEEIGGQNGTAANGTVILVVVEYSEENSGSASNSSENSSNVLNDSSETSNGTAISQNQPSTGS